MVRLVKRTPQEPTRYVIEGKETWLCKCGLSKKPAVLRRLAQNHEG
jgi:CDGSH-type Zn-finger protein